jgi:type II secretory pathway predicted ATPase ExeA
MYQEFWGLHEAPFKGQLDPGGFFLNPTHEEALARFDFLVSDRRRLGVLLGDAGTGKSLLFEVLAGEFRRAGHQVAKLSLLGLSAEELLWSLAAAWQLNPERSLNLRELWGAVVDRLAEFRYQRMAAVVLLDDADEAESDVLAQVARLAQCELSGTARLTIGLAARRDRVQRLGQRLLELADLRVDIQPWELADTEGYIRHALSAAGRVAATFMPSAIARLHEVSGGVPRQINQLAELCLLAGAGQGVDLIDFHMVETVHEELGVSGAASLVR